MFQILILCQMADWQRCSLILKVLFTPTIALFAEQKQFDFMLSICLPDGSYPTLDREARRI